MKALAAAWVVAFCAAIPVAANPDYLSSEGKLTDDDFYHMVACEAAVGSGCTLPLVRWPAEIAQHISIGITRQDDSFPSDRLALINSALDAAIAEINSTGAAVGLVRRKDAPLIEVLLLDRPEKTKLTNTGIKDLDGNWMDAAYVHIWWNGRHELVKGVIIISPAVEPGAIRSVVLEETVQAMGLLTDIDNPFYKDRSIFDQHSNTVVTLSGQDAMALRRHYPLKD